MTRKGKHCHVCRRRREKVLRRTRTEVVPLGSKKTYIFSIAAYRGEGKSRPFKLDRKEGGMGTLIWHSKV